MKTADRDNISQVAWELNADLFKARFNCLCHVVPFSAGSMFPLTKHRTSMELRSRRAAAGNKEQSIARMHVKIAYSDGASVSLVILNILSKLVFLIPGKEVSLVTKKKKTCGLLRQCQ